MLMKDKTEENNTAYCNAYSLKHKECKSKY